MKHISFLLLVIIFVLPVKAQHFHYFEQCSETKRFSVETGDTIVVKCGSAVMMSEPVFDLYNTAYKKMSAPALRDLVTSYEGIIAQQNKRIEEQEKDYNTMKQALFSLADSSNKMITHATGDLRDINQNLDKVNRDLSEAKNEIVSAQKDLGKAVKVGGLKKILWGSGGFASGVMVTLLIGAIL